MDEAPDDDELAQWMAVCDDCDNPVEHYCNTCGDKLCGSCKQQHLSRKKNRNHEVVLYTAGVAVSASSTAICDKHPGKLVDLYCKPCQKPVCSQCVAESHGDHKLASLTEVYSQARDQATSIFKRMRTEDRPRLMEEKESATNIREMAVDCLKRTEEKMRQRAKQFHQEIDTLLETDLERLREIRDNDVLPRARAQEVQANEKLEFLEKKIKSYEGNLRSGNPVTLMSFMEGSLHSLDNQLAPSEYNEISVPDFASEEININVLRDQFGLLVFHNITSTAGKSDDIKRSKVVKEPEDVKQKEGAQTKESEKEIACRGSIMKKARLQSEFTITYDYLNELDSLRLLNKDQIWIHGERHELLFIDSDGNMLKKVDAKCQIYWFTGMTVTNRYELLYCDIDGEKVMKVEEKSQLKTYLSTKKMIPYGICCLSNGDFIVTFAEEQLVKKYNRNGKVIRDIGNDYLKWPYYVTVNKLNQDICVSDKTVQVVVFSSEGSHRFTYRGNDEGELGFSPFDLCTDLMGNILITDRDNDRVHIVDKDGRFIQYLATEADGLQYPRTIDIDSNGDVWVGEWETKKVKVYKYLS